MQILHFDKINFQTFEKAAQSRDGIVVLSVLFKIGQFNRELHNILDFAPYIYIPEELVCLPNSLDLNNLLPADIERFWTYQGTLTKPNSCEVNSRWIIMANPVDFSQPQLDILQSLLRRSPSGKTNEFEKILKNYNKQVPSFDYVSSSW